MGIFAGGQSVKRFSDNNLRLRTKAEIGSPSSFHLFQGNSNSSMALTFGEGLRARRIDKTRFLLHTSVKICTQF